MQTISSNCTFTAYGALHPETASVEYGLQNVLWGTAVRIGDVGTVQITLNNYKKLLCIF